MLLQVSLPRLEKINKYNDYISSKLVYAKKKKKEKQPEKNSLEFTSSLTHSSVPASSDKCSHS